MIMSVIDSYFIFKRLERILELTTRLVSKVELLHLKNYKMNFLMESKTLHT